MRRLFVALTSAVGVVAFTHMASAADVYQPVYKAAPPPAPVSGWAGWYVGVNAGASFGNVKTDFNAPVTIFFNASNGPASGTADFAGSDTVYPSGFMGGGQIGYNWQFSPIWVVGLEADFQGADEKDHSTLTSNFSAPLFFLATGGPNGQTATGTTALDYTAKIEWFGTARVRAGYVWGNGNVMSYLTGGLAYGKVDVEGTSALTAAVSPFISVPSITQAFGHSNVNIGWVVGYGTEGKTLIPGLSWKVEGLWMDLGTLDATGPGGTATSTVGTLPTGFIMTTTAGPVTTHSHFTDGILRGGLNYHF